MLVPAIFKKNELEKLFAEHLYDDDMFLYNGYPYCNTIPDLAPAEGVYKWAIIDSNTYQDKVIGYFTYWINNHCESVQNFGLYSFDKNNPIIGFDVYKKMKELINDYRRIEWRMIGGNPVEKHYDKLCKHFRGNKVILHNVVKDRKGNYHNELIYEIMKIEGVKFNEKNT